MNPNSRKNTKLLKQFPFLRDIIARPLEPTSADNRLDNLTIKVERADEPLMFRQAENIGLGEESFLIVNEQRIGRQGEYLFAVGRDNAIINSLSWPRNRGEQCRCQEIYAKMIFWGFPHLLERTSHLVWANVRTDHERETRNRVPSFGALVRRTMHLTVYLAPDQGFENLHENARLSENLYLCSDVLIRGVLKENRDIIKINGNLDELCRRFENRVYLNGMKDILDRSTVRGASGSFGEVRVLSYEMCGYRRFTLSDRESWLSFQQDSTTEPLYVLGMSGRLSQLRKLTDTVVELWNSMPELRTGFKPDPEVSIF